MNVVLDTRPSCELSDSEIVAHLFREVRGRQFKTARQVQDMCKRMFPDLGPDRTRDCLVQLANALQ